MPESTILPKLVIVIVIVLILFLILISVPCEKYTQLGVQQEEAEFLVNNPKSVDYFPTYTTDNITGTQESFMLTPSKEGEQVYPYDFMMGGELMTTSNNPYYGALPNEALYGVSAPQRQGPLTTTLSNSGNEARALWSTVI